MTSRSIRIASLVCMFIGFAVFLCGIYGLYTNVRPGFLVLSAFNLLMGFGLLLWNFKNYLIARDLDD